VAPNRLGAVNHVLLTREALPEKLRAASSVVLMTPPRADSATRSNRELLQQMAIRNVCQLPWLGVDYTLGAVLRKARVRKALAMVAGLPPWWE
jgi:dethiobiotin synthetase